MIYYPVLCGGTFFTLLLEAAKHEIAGRKKVLGNKEEFSEMDVFEALLQIAVPTYRRPTDGDNFRPIVSAYKSCSGRNGGSLPIYNHVNAMIFDDRMRTDYHALHADASVFLDRFIDVEGKGKWLVKALLELIALDESIPDNVAFAVCGKTITKEELVRSGRIDLAALLLGIWHFIILNRPDNTAGKDTYESWCKPGRSRNTREPFKSNIGSGITQEITLVQFEGAEGPSDREHEEPEDSGEPQYNHHEQYYYSPPGRTQVINHPFICNQYGGGNSRFIGNVGVLIINND